MLKQLQPGPLGRAARMVLSAARKAPPASVVSPNSSHGEPGPRNPESAGEAHDLPFLCLASAFFPDSALCTGLAHWLQVEGKNCQGKEKLNLP